VAAGQSANAASGDIMNSTLTCLPATPAQMDEFLELLRLEAADYLDQTMALMEMTWPQFVRLVQTVGRVFAVHRAGQVVGFCWIEERERVVHLHGLFIGQGFQGQGIGTQVLNMLVQQYTGHMDAIELGVHESNTRARALYERVGYRTTKHLAELGFYVLQRPLPC
jgi:ribosomal protein S18 acetylase RimI-like enzyme